jgi:hypothetical protein
MTFPLSEARRNLLDQRSRSMGSEAQVSFFLRPIPFPPLLWQDFNDASGLLVFRWDGLRTFLSLPRQPLYCGASKGTKAFVRSHKNLHFYWILGAGHYVSPKSEPQLCRLI